MVALFGRPQSWQALLSDGDTGWHIRTGDFILRTGGVPLHDLFSFSRSQEPWFVREWLSDTVFRSAPPLARPGSHNRVFRRSDLPVAVLIQSDRFGASIGQTLRGHSDYMRVMARQRAEGCAAKLAVKLVFPIFFCILPSLFVVTLGPRNDRLVRNLIPMVENMGTADR